MPTSTLVDRQLHDFLASGTLSHIDGDSIQPASIDLSLSDTIWQIAGIPSIGGSNGFSPKSFIKQFCLNTFSLAKQSVTLNTGNIYLAKLNGTYALPADVFGQLSPKSSIGRIDLHCIALAEGGRAFNSVKPGYKGELYVLMIPQSFPVQVTPGIPLIQLRLFQGKRQILSVEELSAEQKLHELVHENGAPTLLTDQGAVLHLDLECSPSNLVAHRSGKPIDLNGRNQDPSDYFREKRLTHGALFLEPDEFVLATTIERVRVPTHLCAEMVPFQEEYGEIRTHYAGFFDPGFGYGKKGEVKDSGVVCEIRNIGSAPLMIAHGQPVCLLRYEKLDSLPDKNYGGEGLAIASHYQGQSGVRLGKFFSPWPAS